MKILHSWLKDLVDIKLKPQKLAQRLTMAGLSVESLEEIDGDFVYEIEVTSNRPDWLSMRGVAREVAAVSGAAYKKEYKRFPLLPKACVRKTDVVSLGIEDTKDCPLYCGNLIYDVKVGPSPQWLRSRLEKLGLRCVNNIVDITNYCLLEHGQPLHAFDFDCFAQKQILVRRAHRGEKINLIDGSQKILTPDVLVITDGELPLAAAGIMGGRDSEVGNKTTTLLLESASFDPVVVRRGTRQLGVASDSSYRFERGIDRAGVKLGLDRATELICLIAGGKLSLSKSAGSRKAPSVKKISFSLAEAKDILSLPLTPQKTKGILTKLGFSVRAKSKDVFEIGVPSYRRDVRIAEDLIEELARAYGYDQIPLSKPSIKPCAIAVGAFQKVESQSRDLLVRMGLKEVINYSLVNERDYQKCSLMVDEDILRLENPINEEYALLRTTLLPGLLSCVALNTSRGNKNFEFFEIANTFKARKEELFLGLVLSGKKRTSWEKEAKEYTFFDLKGIIETLLEGCGIAHIEFCRELALPCFQEGTAATFKIEGKVVGILGKVRDEVKRTVGIKTKEDVYLAEMNLDALVASLKQPRRFKALSTMPSILRDISLLVPNEVSYAQIKRVIEERLRGSVKSISLIDCYKGKELTAGCVGLTISVEYHNESRTLTDQEIEPLHQELLKKLTDALSLEIR